MRPCLKKQTDKKQNNKRKRRWRVLEKLPHQGCPWLPCAHTNTHICTCTHRCTQTHKIKINHPDHHVCGCVHTHTLYMNTRESEKEESVKPNSQLSGLPTRTNHGYPTLDHPTFQSRTWAEALSVRGANIWVQLKVPESSDGDLGWS